MGAVFARRGIYPLSRETRRVDNAPEAGRCRLVAGLGRKIASNLFCAGGEFRICLKPTLDNINPAILVFLGNAKPADYPDDGPGHDARCKDKAIRQPAGKVLQRNFRELVARSGEG